MPTALEPDAPVRASSSYDVFAALAKLQGRTHLIRMRMRDLPADDQQRLVALLSEIEVQITLLTRQLEAAERAGLGPPF